MLMLNEISNLIKKFRKAADMLESLLESNPESNGKAAKSIRKNMDNEMAQGKTAQGLAFAKKNNLPVLIIKKKKLHWTQTRDGKRKMSALIKRAYARKKAAGKPWRDKEKV
jgi:hypothetical protein